MCAFSTGWLLPVFTLLALACSSVRPNRGADMGSLGTPRTPKLEIRVRNECGLKLERVRVRFPETGETDYGDVPDGGMSTYHLTTRAHRYAPVIANAGDRELSFQPMDYVGEQELGEGRYTYVLRVSNGVLTITLENDK